MNSICYMIFVPSIGLPHKYIFCCRSYKDLQNLSLICVLMTESESESAQSHTSPGEKKCLSGLFCTLPREMGCWSRTVVFNLWDSDTAIKRSTEGDRNRKHSLYQLMNTSHKGILAGYLFYTSKTEVSFKSTDSDIASVNVISTLKNNTSERIHFMFCKVRSSRKSSVR